MWLGRILSACSTLKVPSHKPALLSLEQPHFPNGKTELSKEEGGGLILQGVKLGRELWVFLMSVPEPWPPPPPRRVTSWSVRPIPTLAASLGKRHVWD